MVLPYIPFIFSAIYFLVSLYCINFALIQETKSTNQTVKEIEEKQRVHANSQNLSHDLRLDWIIFVSKNRNYGLHQRQSYYLGEGCRNNHLDNVLENNVSCEGYQYIHTWRVCYLLSID